MRGRSLFDFLADERAVTSIEYALIASFIFLVIIAGVSAVGTKLSANYWGPVSSNWP